MLLRFSISLRSTLDHFVIDIIMSLVQHALLQSTSVGRDEASELSVRHFRMIGYQSYFERNGRDEDAADLRPARRVRVVAGVDVFILLCSISYWKQMS